MGGGQQALAEGPANVRLGVAWSALMVHRLANASLSGRQMTPFPSEQGRVGDDLTSEVAHALQGSMAPNPSGTGQVLPWLRLM